MGKIVQAMSRMSRRARNLLTRTYWDRGILGRKVEWYSMFGGWRSASVAG